MGFLGGSVVKNAPANAGDAEDKGSIPGLGRSGKGNGNPFQNSCLENPMDRGTWWATVHRAAKSWTWLKRLNKNNVFCTVSQSFPAGVAGTSLGCLPPLLPVQHPLTSQINHCTNISQVASTFREATNFKKCFTGQMWVCVSQFNRQQGDQTSQS